MTERPEPGVRGDRDAIVTGQEDAAKRPDTESPGPEQPPREDEDEPGPR